MGRAPSLGRCFRVSGDVQSQGDHPHIHSHGFPSGLVAQEIHRVARVVADQTHRVQLQPHLRNLLDHRVELAQRLAAGLELFVGGPDDGEFDGALGLAEEAEAVVGAAWAETSLAV